jgi:hypothetical protein
MYLARPVGEHAGRRLREVDALVRLTHPARRQACDLLARHADPARPLDLLAQRAQRAAVDAAGRRQRIDAFERGGQRRGDLGAERGDESLPIRGFGAAAVSSRRATSISDRSITRVFVRPGRRARAATRRVCLRAPTRRLVVAPGCAGSLRALRALRAGAGFDRRAKGAARVNNSRPTIIRACLAPG